MAQARAGAAHQCATLDACRHAWAARASAGSAMQMAADANGRIVGRAGGLVSRSAIAETAAAMQRAVDALEAAAAEFGQAARLSAATAQWWARAAKSLGRGGLGEMATAARERDEEARKMVRTLDRWSRASRQEARGFQKSASGWVANTAGWKDGHRMDRIADRDGWMASRSAMRRAADAERSRAEDMERQTAWGARAAAGELARVAADSDRRAAALGVLDGPDAQEAAAAWTEGMEAAGRAWAARPGAGEGGGRTA